MNKPLPIQFGGGDSDQFTQIKRSDKAALYKRETAEGAFITFEVFAIKAKNDVEVYPNEDAMSKWAWCPISQTRAETYFKRINDGEIAIPNVDPETSEMIPLENDPSLEELMAQDDPIVTTAVIVQAPVVEIPVDVLVEDPTAPTATQHSVETAITANADVSPIPLTIPDVTPLVDGSAAVTVAKVTKTKVQPTMVIPTGSFTQAQFAVANGLPERGIVWSKLDFLVQNGKLNKTMQKMGRGRPAAVFTAV